MALFSYGVLYIVGAVNGLYRRACWEVGTVADQQAAYYWLFGWRHGMCSWAGTWVAIERIGAVLMCLPPAVACFAFLAPKLCQKVAEIVRDETWYEGERRRSKGLPPKPLRWNVLAERLITGNWFRYPPRRPMSNQENKICAP